MGQSDARLGYENSDASLPAERTSPLSLDLEVEAFEALEASKHRSFSMSSSCLISVTGLRGTCWPCVIWTGKRCDASVWLQRLPPCAIKRHCWVAGHEHSESCNSNEGIQKAPLVENSCILKAVEGNGIGMKAWGQLASLNLGRMFMDTGFDRFSEILKGHQLRSTQIKVDKIHQHTSTKIQQYTFNIQYTVHSIYIQQYSKTCKHI